jgi:hypothetical protein
MRRESLGDPSLANEAHLRVVLRQSPNWGREAQSREQMDHFDALIGRAPGTTASLKACWNEVMPVCFDECRAALKAIAAETLAAMEATVFEPIEAFMPPFEGPSWYTFTDDDDWFAPNLASHLAGLDAKAAVWTSVRFDGTVLWRANDGFCYTNNYAVRGSFLDPEHFQHATQHMWAQPLLQAHPEAPALLETPLSVTNKHPCSFVTLERTGGERQAMLDLLAPYCAFLDQSDAGRTKMAADVAWALPAMIATSELFCALRDRL